MKFLLLNIILILKHNIYHCYAACQLEGVQQEHNSRKVRKPTMHFFWVEAILKELEDLLLLMEEQEDWIVKNETFPRAISHRITRGAMISHTLIDT